MTQRFLHWMTRDGRLLFMARMVRMFGYGFLAVILVLYLAALGFGETRIGLLLTLTLAGDTVISLWLSTHADRYGRRLTLLVGALLVVGAGLVFLASHTFWLLLTAATIGVISPSGYEVGPFLAVEQAALTEAVPADHRTTAFAWYNLAGSIATAVGSLAGGGVAKFGQLAGLEALGSYRVVIAGYAVLGIALALLFSRVTSAVEIPASAAHTARARFGLYHSKKVVLHLAGLFALDAFAGGFVIQSLLAYWFYVRFGTHEATLGMIFFGANLLAGISALAASAIANRFGLVNTMVFTHLPSNLLLMVVPLMPTLSLAIV
ncbi:MAG TPA: MFS transporter, partial [Candidatus Baltobacteraceae bacterium]|nr:MFS transporter [Candidatus Baltobacteraceae bacterium]